MIAGLAGAPSPVALRLGLAMFVLQCSIGALNDLVDAPLDARQKPRKPLPAGQVGRRAAIVVAATGAGTGIALSAVSGGSTAVAAIAGLGLGYVYDLRLSRTVLSMLPLSLALPLLPIHAWLGATNTIPDGLVTLIPVGILGGAGLALANGLVDIDRDTKAGRNAVAVVLGGRAALVVQTLLLGAAGALAVVAAPAVPGGHAGSLELLRAVRLGGIGLGILALAVGTLLLRASGAGIRERGWEFEAVGVAALGVGWLAGTAAAAGGGAGA